MMKQLGSGERVSVDLDHLKQHEDVLPFLDAALFGVYVPETKPRFIKEQIDFGRPIGKANRATVYPGDEVVYAPRWGRDNLTKFVKGREGGMTNFVTVVLLRTGKKDCYRLLTAYIGTMAEREPGDKSVRTMADIEISQKFWHDQALLWDPHAVDPASVVSGPPVEFGTSADVEPEEEEFEGMSQYGFPQQYIRTIQGVFSICVSCKCHMMPNAGRGMACDTCQYESEMEMRHDYEEGYSL